MDPPPYPYHQTRYASAHPYPAAAAAAPPNYRHHNNYQQQLQPPPPQQPQHPPPSSSSAAAYHTLPPPPPPPHQYNPNQPQLPAFHSLHDYPTSSPRLSHRLPGDDDRHRHLRLSQYLETKPESWEKPTRLYVDYDRELHNPQFRVEPESTASARLRAEYNEQLLREDYGDRRRARVEPSSDSKYRELGFVPNQKASSFDPDSGGYDARYDDLVRSGGRRESRDEVYEDSRRRVYHDIDDRYDRQGSRELYDPFEVDKSDGGRSASGPRDYYGSESGRGSGTTLRRKQTQKKSALLRLEMARPNQRSHSGYYDSSGSGSHREREYYEHSGRRMDDEEERARSPLHLDVSFKSNSLVAKTVGDRNVRGNAVSDRDFESSQHPKLNAGGGRLRSSIVVVNKASNAEKESRHLEEKVSTSGNDRHLEEKVSTSGNGRHLEEKVTTSGNTRHLEEKVTTSSKSDINSQPRSNGTCDSVGNKEKERALKGNVLQKDGNIVGSGQMHSLKVAKKKKVVKKVVKKVINRQPKPKNKIDEPRAADSIFCSPSVAFGTDKGETSSFSDACPTNVHALSVNSKVDGSSVNRLSDEHGTDTISANANSCSKKTGNSSTSNLGSSIHEEMDIDQVLQTADASVQGLLKTSNFSNNVIDSLRVTSSPEIGGYVDISKQVCQGRDGLSLDKLIRKESLETMLSVEGNANSGLLNSEKKNITNAKGSGHGTQTTLNFDSGMKVSHQEIKANDAGSEQPCTDQFSTPLETGFVEVIPKATSSMESSRTVGMSSSGETLAVVSNNDKGTTWCSGKVITNYDENIAESIPKKPISFKIRAPKKFPIFAKPGGGSKSSTDEVQKKRKARTSLDSSRVSNSSADPISVSPIHKNSVDTTVSSSLKDNSHTEVSVSGVQKLDIDSEPGNEGASILRDRSVDVFCEPKQSGRSDVNCDPNETSPRSIKRRKVSTSHLVLTTSQTNDRPADKSTSHLVLTASQTNDRPADKSASYMAARLTSNDDPSQQEHEIAASSTDVRCATANLMPSQEGSTVFSEDNLAGISSDVAAAVHDAFTNDSMKFEHQGTPSIYEESGVPDTLFVFPSQSRNEQKEVGKSVVNNNDLAIMDIETTHKESFDVRVSEEQVMVHSETAPCGVPSEVQPPELGNKSCKYMEADNGFTRDKLPSVSDCVLLCANGNEVSTTDSDDARMEPVPDTLSTVGSPETSTDVPDMQMLDCSPSVVKISDDKGCGDYQKLDLKSFVEGVSDAAAQCTKTNLTSEPVTEGDQLVMGNTVALPLKDVKGTNQGLKLISADSGLKNQLGQAAHRIVPGRSYSAFTTSNSSASSAQVAKPRTWHRNGSSSGTPLPASMPFSSTIQPQRQLPQRDGRFQSNSYVRKGNSLVRKPVPVAATPQNSPGFGSSGYWSDSSGVDGLKKNAGTNSKIDVKNSSSLMRTGGMNTPFDRPTPPLPNGAKLSTGGAISLGVCISSPLAEPLLSGETTLDSVSSLESNDPKVFVKESLTTSEAQENHSGLLCDTEIQGEGHDRNVEASNTKKIVYVKRKLNQLVASSNSCDLPVQNAEKIQQSSSDGYYKKRKNQLIRTSLEGNANQAVAMHENNLNSQVQRVPPFVPNRTYSKKRSHKAFAKTRKIGKNSLVWTALGTQPSNNGDHQKVLPHLFPWKRARYGRNFMQSQASSFKYSSASTISKKLLLSRRRDTVYTRSTHGFSLKMYKVLSVGGSSLKWSKSIENRSKKANEEATRAVAAVEKKKRENNDAVCSSTGSKFRNNSSGKRIFRIGSVRYKMDPSRRTLKRISDDQSSSSAIVSPEKDAKRSYVPKRLVIGNDEYVRIGNGNQLVRNPKKRTRILASERVRWSLHTARLRLAKKRKYCQFFTRFGKCNKDDGKCPFIHDPSKIAVCTKFLKGLCSNSNCKLTHKVLPERMPDCSYFLQGLCSNENCPYRHVHVNPKASTCEGFLKGYCADGNECRKKHSYVCPSFEATGTCPQGPKCKLHHPRNRTKGKKRKRSREQKNAWGRYFVSKDISTSEPKAVYGKHCAENGSDILVNGMTPDFISIDVSDEEAGETNETESERAAFYDSDTSELELDDLDELIKPVLLLRKSPKTNIT